MTEKLGEDVGLLARGGHEGIRAREFGASGNAHIRALTRDRDAVSRTPPRVCGAR
jgi:hypothetical protein